jgi:HK97 gp10 family phage protein
MLSIGAKIDGDLTAGFDKLIEAAGESTLRATGVAGARVIQAQAIANTARFEHPTGIIKKNIIIKRLEEESKDNQTQSYIVTVRTGKHNVEGDAFYWDFVERGHAFVPRNPTSKNWKAHREAAKAEYGTSTVPAKPFMRPAFESKKGAALEAMKKRMAEKISEYLGQK